MTVRPAEPRDADAVLALMEGLTRPAVADDPGPQREVFLAHLGHEDAHVFVAEIDGVVAGAVSLCQRAGFSTPAPTRRAGVAATCSSSSPGTFLADGDRINPVPMNIQRAHRLYESYGFKHYARAYALEL